MPTPIIPAEWEKHEFVWIGFPHNADEWPGFMADARRDVAAFANAVQAAGEQVRLVVYDQENADIAAKMVSSHVDIRIHKFGDIWLRDTGPIIIGQAEEREARTFDFNGWGGKFEMDGDSEIGEHLVREAGLKRRHTALFFEGGAIDVDGTGLAVTTEECLLNENRNPKYGRQDIERVLHEALGINEMLWLGGGLKADHTDGHVDNLARFIGPRWLAIPRADDRNDPNAEIFADARARAEAAGISVASVPSPGKIEREGQLIPASYMNFYIANDKIIVPIYGSPNDQKAVDMLDSVFPDRSAVGVPALGLISGGGSFHCCSQQMPL